MRQGQCLLLLPSGTLISFSWGRKHITISIELKVIFLNYYFKIIAGLNYLKHFSFWYFNTALITYQALSVSCISEIIAISKIKLYLKHTFFFCISLASCSFNTFLAAQAASHSNWNLFGWRSWTAAPGLKIKRQQISIYYIQN